MRFLTGLLALVPAAGVITSTLCVRVSGLAAEQGAGASSWEWLRPDPRWQTPFARERPIFFVNAQQQADEWKQLMAFWNPATETVRDPTTGLTVTRNVVRIKVPRGLMQSPPVPPENPLTVARWALGKRLFFDPVLSSDGRHACASCHQPRAAFSDGKPLAVGIGGAVGAVRSPSLLNAAYSPHLFWDGRAGSLEEQAQGPVENAREMFDGRGDAWRSAVERVRAKGDYAERFREAFGTEPTRDTIAKALACYERTILCGNSVHDRAEVAARQRLGRQARPMENPTNAEDYELVLWEALARDDQAALVPLGIRTPADAGKIPDVARRLEHGRSLFFEKHACHHCHAGDRFTDGLFHNIGIGVKNGVIRPSDVGRFGRLPLGRKDVALLGAFKTPTLRGVATAGPHMHDGSLTSLESVVDYYDQGGEPSDALDFMMRDLDAERAWIRRREAEGLGPTPDVREFGGGRRAIVPLRLKLTSDDKRDLVLFVRSLSGDPVDPVVSGEEVMPEDRR